MKTTEKMRERYSKREDRNTGSEQGVNRELQIQTADPLHLRYWKPRASRKYNQMIILKQKKKSKRTRYRSRSAVSLSENYF